MADQPGRNLKGFEDFSSELEAIERDIHQKVTALDAAHPGYRLAVHQAEWHVRGLVYHCRKLVECYGQVAQGVADRVVGTGADVVLMYAPAIQEMWFEFYALVNLARIMLDHLRDLLVPVFVT